MTTHDGQLLAVESAIRGWVESGIHPTVIAIGLNNAFAFGESIIKGGFSVGDDELKEIFEGIDKFQTACEKVLEV